jgi:hypothetical protein
MDAITKFVFIAIGTCFALAGIILFAKKNDQNKNTIKALGFEFSLSGSSLVIFVIGVALIVFPFTGLVHEENANIKPADTTSPSANSPVLPPKNIAVISIPVEVYKKMIAKEIKTEEQIKKGNKKIKELEAELAMVNQNNNLRSVTVTWDPNSEPDVAGYRLYYGTTPDHYNLSANVEGNVSEYRIGGLVPGIYYLAVTAYDINGNESSYSDIQMFDLNK